MEINYQIIKDKYSSTEHKQLITSLIWLTFKTDIIKNIFVGIILETIIITNMYLIKIFINWINQDTKDVTQGLAYSIQMICLMLLSLIIRNRFLLMGRVLSLNIKKSISGILFDKLLRANKASLAQTQSAKFISIVSSDLNVIENEFHYTSYIIISPVIVTASLWIISKDFGEASIFGFCAYVAIVILQIFWAKSTIQWRYQEVCWSEKRLKSISEAINGIRTIKTFGWEYPYSDLINKNRRLQVMYWAINHCIAAIGSSFFQNGGYFIAFVIFGYHYLNGREFALAETMFAISILSYLSFLIIYYSYFGFCTIASFSSVLTRIGEIFSIEENEQREESENICSKVCIQFENATFGWRLSGLSIFKL